MLTAREEAEVPPRMFTPHLDRCKDFLRLLPLVNLRGGDTCGSDVSQLASGPAGGGIGPQCCLETWNVVLKSQEPNREKFRRFWKTQAIDRREKKKFHGKLGPFLVGTPEALLVLQTPGTCFPPPGGAEEPSNGESAGPLLGAGSGWFRVQEEPGRTLNQRP